MKSALAPTINALTEAVPELFCVFEILHACEHCFKDKILKTKPKPLLALKRMSLAL